MLALITPLNIIHYYMHNIMLCLVKKTEKYTPWSLPKSSFYPSVFSPEASCAIQRWLSIYDSYLQVSPLSLAFVNEEQSLASLFCSVK